MSVETFHSRHGPVHCKNEEIMRLKKGIGGGIVNVCNEPQMVRVTSTLQNGG